MHVICYQRHKERGEQDLYVPHINVNHTRYGNSHVSEILHMRDSYSIHVFKIHVSKNTTELVDLMYIFQYKSYQKTR